jgi:MOSC domain-containing protein YiiM
MSVIIRAVLVGRVAPLGRHGVPSGIDKRPVYGPIAITFTGLSGDAQGDSKHQGGPEKAIHHYPFDHYGRWRAEHPDLAWRLTQPGAFGENISTDELTETDVCIGDIYRLGTALIQVSQGRQPCWRLNERFDDPRMARRVQESGRTGWYYRVLQTGHVAAGDTISLVERPAEGWTLERILHVLYRDTLNAESLARLTELPQLAESWRGLARRRLDTRIVESWSRRLETPEGAVP